MKDKLKKIRKSRIFTLVEILIFIAACFGVGCSVAYVQHELDPTDAAVVYFRAFVQKNYDKMYKCLNLDDDYYINRDMYVAAMKKTREAFTIDSYDIEKPETVEGLKSVTIKCNDESSNNSQDFIIYLTGERKGLQLIPDYYVNIDKMTVKDFQVTIPKEDTLELNGEKITDKTAKVTSSGNNTIYSIKYILNGNYKVSATNKYYATVNNINLIKKDTKIDLTAKNYTANDKYTKILTDNGNNVIEQFYRAVRTRKPTRKDLINCFKKNKKLTDKVQKLAEESQEIVYWKDTKNIDKYNVIDMKMTDLVPTIKYNSDKTYTVTYNYSYNYTSATDTTLASSYVDKLSGKCTCKMKLTYTLKGDDVVLTNISLSNKNKKDGE